MTPALDPNKQKSSPEESLPNNGPLQPFIKRGIEPFIQRAIQPMYFASSKKNSSEKTLPDPIKEKMESSFGEDFSDVQVHTDSNKAEALGAKAYAQGKDLHFAPGEFQPNTKEGQELIGHELTHVVQQKEGMAQGGAVQGNGLVNQDAVLEQEADEMGRLVSEGKEVSVSGKGSGVMRKEGDDKFNNSIFNQLETTGVSEDLAHNDGLNVAGVEGSKKFAEKDWSRIQQYASLFKEIGDQHGIPGALLAAIASRESRGGLLLNDDGYGLYDPNGYGLMQIDKVANASLTSDDPDSKAHIETATKLFIQLYAEVKAKHPDWEKAWQLRGAIAAYNFGSDDVDTKEGIDKGTTGNDYSADIWERAKYFAAMKEFSDGNMIAISKDNHSEDSDEGKWFPSISFESLWGTEKKTTENIEYVVGDKETPEKIANKYGITKEELLAINKDKVKTWGTVKGFNKGEKIKIPVASKNLLEQGWEATKNISSKTWENTKEITQEVWSDATDLGEDLAEGAQELSEKAWEGTKEGAETASNWVKSWFEDKEETSEPTTKPEKKVEDSKNKYLSQRDNTFTSTWSDMYGMAGDNKVYGDNECNVTALAMALTRVEKYETLVSNTVALLQDYGNTEKAEVLQKQQLEDLILKLFEQIGYDYFVEDLRKYLGEEDDWAPKVPPHQYARCLGDVGTKILGKGHATTGGELLTKDAYQNFKTKLTTGGVILGTDLTSSGHVVSLQEVLDDGIIINDPYGLQFSSQGKYLKNSSSITQSNFKDIKDNKDLLQKKLKYSPEIQKFVLNIKEDDIGKINFPKNMGARNFYTWKQITNYRIGWYFQLIK